MRTTDGRTPPKCAPRCDALIFDAMLLPIDDEVMVYEYACYKYRYGPWRSDTLHIMNPRRDMALYSRLADLESVESTEVASTYLVRIL
jgi:hypothetical protein